MGPEPPLQEPASGNQPLITSSPQQLSGANGEHREGPGSESRSHEAPSAEPRRVEVVGAVSVVNVDTGSDASKEAAVQLVDRIEKHREPCKKDHDVFDGGYRTVKNILYIKAHPVYSAAFDEWNRQLKEVRVELVEKEKKEEGLITQIYNIVGFFSVFQGVVLTAVSQLSSGSGEKCRKAWVPVFLTAIAAFLTFFALLKKFKACEDLEGLSVNPRAQRDYFKERITDLLDNGEFFRFYESYPKSSKEAPKNSKKAPKNSKKSPKNLRKVPNVSTDSPSRCSGFWLISEVFGFSSRLLAALQGWSRLKNVVLVSVALFTGVFVLSYYVILCDMLI